MIGWRTRSFIEYLPVLRVVSGGKTVQFIQGILQAAPVDGDFGSITEQYVRDYQSNKGIRSNGIVGRETWTIIITSMMIKS